GGSPHHRVPAIGRNRSVARLRARIRTHGPAQGRNPMTPQALRPDGMVPATTKNAAPAGARPSGLRVVLVQTQAEAAGAQEITRILGRGLTARGYDVYSIFLFRRTAA